MTESKGLCPGGKGCDDPKAHHSESPYSSAESLAPEGRPPKSAKQQSQQTTKTCGCGKVLLDGRQPYSKTTIFKRKLGLGFVPTDRYIWQIGNHRCKGKDRILTDQWKPVVFWEKPHQ